MIKNLITKARNCIKSIRRAVKKDQPAVNTIDLLDILGDLGFIIGFISPAIWNHYMSVVRVNNYLEAHHSHLDYHF